MPVEKGSKKPFNIVIL